MPDIEPGDILVAPNAHFYMGGVVVDNGCRTAIEGLFAAGEECGGVHGANRLGSNALTACWVTGAIAGRNAASFAEGRPLSKAEARPALDWLRGVAARPGDESPSALKRALQETMWLKAGIVRSQASLEAALREVRAGYDAWERVAVAEPKELVAALELQDMLLVSEMIIRAALLRTESRGAHFRSDHPQEREGWLKNITVRRRGEAMELATAPVPQLRP